MGILPEIPEWVGWVLFTIGTLLAINAGKGLAAKKHDAELAKRYGKQLSVFGLALYFYALLSIAFSLFSAIATKALSVSFKFFVGGLNVISILTGVVYPLVIMAVSYAAFRARYSRIDEPITREGKLAMKVAEKEIGIRKKVEKVARPPSPLQMADKAAKGVKEVTKFFVEEEDKEKHR